MVDINDILCGRCFVASTVGHEQDQDFVFECYLDASSDSSTQQAGQNSKNQTRSEDTEKADTEEEDTEEEDTHERDTEKADLE